MRDKFPAADLVVSFVHNSNAAKLNAAAQVKWKTRSAEQEKLFSDPTVNDQLQREIEAASELGYFKQFSVAHALASLATLPSRFASDRARQARKALRQNDKLDDFLLSIVSQDLKISARDFEAGLLSHQYCRVYEDELEITLPIDNSSPDLPAPYFVLERSGLKHRLTRLKKKLKSKSR